MHNSLQTCALRDLTRVLRFGLFFQRIEALLQAGFFTKDRLTNRKNMSIICNQS